MLLFSLSLLLVLQWCSGDTPPSEEKRCFRLLDRQNNTLNDTLVDPGVLYYQLDNSHDKTVSQLRYVWSTVGTPTLFFSVVPASESKGCNKSANNSFEWDNFNFNQSEGSATVPGFDGNFSFAIVFDSLIEFRDEHAKANSKGGFNVSQLNNASLYNEFPLDDLEWEFDEKEQNLTGVSNGTGFSWQIRVNVPTENGRLGYFPKSLFSNTSTTFDFAFNNFTYSNISTCGTKTDNTTCGRVVLRMYLVHGPNTLNGILISNFSLDDEYTPSVFTTKAYLFGTQPEVSPGYLQWKPISYLSSSRQSTSSQQANIITSINESALPDSLASALFGVGPDETINVTTLYLVFGTEGDDNNMNPSYLTWTAVLGYGTPQYDQISFIVIITISLGLGLPVLFIAFGAVFVIVKKKPWQNVARLLSGSRSGSYNIVNNDQIQ